MKKENKELSSLKIICPAYNEEDVIQIFFNELVKILETIESKYNWSILFVLDGIQDSTISILKDLSVDNKKVGVLVLSKNFGHQAALVAGIDYSDSDVIIMMDSDLQHPPELIPKLLRAYEDGNGVVYSIRNKPLDKSLLKRFSSNFFYSLMNRLSDMKLESGEADYRLISRRVANVFKNNIREQNQFLRGLFSWVGFKRHGIRFDSVERMHGESKYNFSKMKKLALSGIVSFSKKPLQYAIGVGLFFALVGFLLGLYSFGMYFIDDKIPSGWTTLSILISFFGGLQLLFLGVVGEYIGAIFDEVKARPIYIVEDKINIE